MVKGYTVTNEERNTVRAKLKQWLEEDGYTVKVLDGKTTYFTLGIEHPTLRVSLTVGQLLGHKDRITILGALSISELHRQKLEELSENQRNEFLWDLKFTLVSNDIPFEMPPRGRASGQLAELDLLPDQIIVSQAVWYDGLTKDSFMRRFHQAVKGMFLVLLKFEHLSGASVFKDEYSKYVV
jgi:hypothetical protein